MIAYTNRMAAPGMFKTRRFSVASTMHTIILNIKEILRSTPENALITTSQN
jgi:hypothetical protein